MYRFLFVWSRCYTFLYHFEIMQKKLSDNQIYLADYKIKNSIQIRFIFNKFNLIESFFNFDIFLLIERHNLWEIVTVVLILVRKNYHKS